jgi:hypothetical protein
MCSVILLLFSISLSVNKHHVRKIKPFIPIGDDGSLYDDCSSGKLIVMIINETKLLWRQQSCQKCKHWQSHFDFLKNDYLVSLF